MRKSIAETSEFRHILPDAVSSGGDESRAGHVDEVFARKRFKYAVGTGAAPRLPARLPQAAHHRRFEYGIALFLLYPFGDRAAGLCRSQRRGTDDPVRRGGHAHERADHHRRGHQEHCGDLHGTGGSRDFRRRAADGSPPPIRICCSTSSTRFAYTWSSIRSTSATPRLSARWAMYAGCFRKCPRSMAAGRVSAPT